MKNKYGQNIRHRVGSFSSKSRVTNVFVFFLLTVLCFYLYAGFQNIYLTITLDHITTYIGSKYILSHPAFTFIIGYPHFVPLYFPYISTVRGLTNDIQWLYIVISLSIHIITAFMLFKITQILTKNKLFPGLMASLFFLVSVIHIDNLVDFTDSYPVVASFFALLSLYFFVRALDAKSDYYRKQLFLSFFFYFLSISCGENFTGLVLFYFLVMLFRIRQLRKDFIYLLSIVVFFFTIRFILQDTLLKLYNIYYTPLSLSLDWPVQKLRPWNYSFLHLTSLFFPRFPTIVASFFHGFKTVMQHGGLYHNRYFPYFSLFVLVIPLAFFKKEKILKLYSLLILMYLLFIPYLFSPVPLADKHLTQTVVASSLFLGLLFHYLFESISKIKVNLLRKVFNLLLILFLGIFFLRYMTIAKREVGSFIGYNSAFSPFIEKFTEEFKKIEIHNEKKQIYFLKNEIPNKYSFLGSGTPHCYHFFYLAVKYKKLPIDLYLHVYSELNDPKFNPEICENYFISLSDGSCFGLYGDKEKLKKLINDNPDITLQDIIVLNWDGELKQESFEPQ